MPQTFSSITNQVGRGLAVAEQPRFPAVRTVFNRCPQVAPRLRGARRDLNAAAFITEWVKDNIPADERETFREMAESDLLSLHEGNFARLQVRPSEFAAWQVVWENKELTFPAPEESYDTGRDVVVFWGSDRKQRIRCAISREALDDHFSGDKKNKLEVFRENRLAIEQIAQRKYLSGRVESDGTVLIRTADIPY